MIYLDNASTTRPDPSLQNIINKYLFEEFGNPGSLHSAGESAKEAIELSRTHISDFLHTTPENIIFTSSGSEANTMAILGLEKYLKSINKTHIITSKYEHHSVLNSFKEMESRGFNVTYINTPRGEVDVRELKNSIKDNTGLVSIMYVNNEVGTINEIEKIYRICKSRGILFHSDCVQAAGHLDVAVGETADIITISGHKLHAPKGIGCVCANNIHIISNIIYGGKQELGLRPGTENVAYIAAFGEIVSKINILSERLHSNELRINFVRTLLEECKRLGVDVLFNTHKGIKNISKILSIRFPGIDAHTLILTLSDDVCVSSGAACSSGDIRQSHVLLSCGLSEEDAMSTIRVSFSSQNTVFEVRKAAKVIAESAHMIKTKVF